MCSTSSGRSLDIVNDRHGRYYLIEQPWAAWSWVYDGVLADLYQQKNSWLARGDQCAYGNVDADPGKPQQKATGWLSNSQLILNKLAKRCSCAPVEHETVIGSDSKVSRAGQAAEYVSAGSCTRHLRRRETADGVRLRRLPPLRAGLRQRGARGAGRGATSVGR